MRVQLSEREGDGRCAFCHDGESGMERDHLERCPGCGALTHPDCRKLLPRCPTIGCSGQGPTLGPTWSEHERSERRLLELEVARERLEHTARHHGEQAELAGRMMRALLAAFVVTLLWLAARHVLTVPIDSATEKRDPLPALDRAVQTGSLVTQPGITLGGTGAGQVLTLGTGTRGGTWSEPAVGSSMRNHAAWDSDNCSLEVYQLTCLGLTNVQEVCEFEVAAGTDPERRLSGTFFWRVWNDSPSGKLHVEDSALRMAPGSFPDLTVEPMAVVLDNRVTFSLTVKTTKFAHVDAWWRRR